MHLSPWHMRLSCNTWYIALGHATKNPWTVQLPMIQNQIMFTLRCKPQHTSLLLCLRSSPASVAWSTPSPKRPRAWSLSLCPYSYSRQLSDLLLELRYRQQLLILNCYGCIVSIFYFFPLTYVSNANPDINTFQLGFVSQPLSLVAFSGSFSATIMPPKKPWTSWKMKAKRQLRLAP